MPEAHAECRAAVVFGVRSVRSHNIIRGLKVENTFGRIRWLNPSSQILQSDANESDCRRRGSSFRTREKRPSASGRDPFCAGEDGGPAGSRFRRVYIRAGVVHADFHFSIFFRGFCPGETGVNHAKRRDRRAKLV